MIDSTAVIITIEFLALIFIMAGLIFWLDRKQSERLDRMDKRFEEEFREVKRDMRALNTKVDALSSKADRMQGTLDVLVFGDRGVPPPVASERAETARRLEESVGD